MQQTKKRLFALALALLALSSCSQDASDVQGSATGSETVTFSLRAEVSVDDEQSRAINYKLGNNAQGQLVPLPQFTDGQEVEVHTILKSSNGAVAAKTLKWKYSADSKKLVLSQGSHDIEVAGFNNDNGTKWYISGLIGGALYGTQVEFMGSRVVKGVDGNAGDALGSMDVPYAFGWTELTINTSSPKDSEGSHKYAEVPASKNVKFQPLGSMLAVKLGTNQRAGAYTFTPKGFTLSSNAWGDQGSFELSTDIPPTDPHRALPIWTEGSCAGSMYYTFASGEEPDAIAHNQTTAKTYYVWVMPHKTVPTGAADVRVMLKGTSSRPETETYKDYTNTWFTDYTTEGKATQGKVTSGRVHPLTAKASHRVAIPIEYVTEYNLAGGEGLTHKIASGSFDGELNTPALGGVQPIGVTGSLRFANFDDDGQPNGYGHRNDASGYYNWYKVAGRYNATYNPDARNLQAEVDKIFGTEKYYIPAMDQWWGISSEFNNWSSADDELGKREWMRVGLGADVFRQSYLSDYSKGFSADNLTNDAIVYAIRFKARILPFCYSYYEGWDYDTSTQRSLSYSYPPAPDNSMKCAYRFRRIGGRLSWDQTKNENLTNRLIVDVVYLGEESSPTELTTISDESWWIAQESAGKVISRILPATGYIAPSFRGGSLGSTGELSYRGGRGHYSSFSLYSMDHVRSWSISGEFTGGTGGISNRSAYAVRLFTQPD